MRLPSRRWRWAAAGVAVALVAVGIALAIRSDSPEPTALEQLERAQGSSDRAQSSSAQITENLERLAENLEAGRDIAGQSEEIQELTTKQQESLEQLTVLLKSQLRALKRTTGALGSTGESSQDVAELSAAQAALLRATVADLQRLRRFAAGATTTSATVRSLAEYGARLAEDSQRAFAE